MFRLYGVVSLIAVTVLASGCQVLQPAMPSATGGSAKPSSADPLSPIVKKAFGAAEAMLSPTGNKFRQLVDKRQLDEAAEVYLKDRHYFDSRAETYNIYVATLAAGLNERFASRLESISPRLATAREKPLFEQDERQWADLRTMIDEAENIVGEYDRLPMLADSRFRHPLADEVRTKRSALIEEWRSPQTVDQSFRRFNHYTGRSFFHAYPAQVSPDDTLHRNAESLRAAWSEADVEKLKAFGKVYQTYLSGNLSRDLDSSLAQAKRRLRGDAPISLASLPQLRQNARSDGSEDSFLDSERLLVLDVTPPRGDVEPDFPIVLNSSFRSRTASTEQYEIGRAPLSPDESVILVVKRRSAIADRKIASKDDMQSSYLAGKELVPNPEYEIARQQYLQAESDYRQQQFSNTLNRPANVFIAVLQGLTEGGLAARRNENFNKFQATPQMIERPVYRNYSFPVANINVEKSASVDVYVIDRAGREYFSFLKTLSESKSFRVASGLNAADKTYTVGSFSREDDIDKFESAPMTFTVEELINTAVDERGKTNVKDERTLLTAFQSPAAVVTSQRGNREAISLARDVKDARSDAVVIIQAGNSLGSGFFVAPHLVITNHHVVAGVRTVEIKLRDGTESVGRVVRTDEGLDLALVKVPEVGAPVSLLGGGFSVGATVEAIGHPKGLTFSLTRGVVSAVRKLPNPIPGGKEILVVQTDAPISPGNSGGPLFLGDKVIGVNTQKLTAKGVEGIGFAVHAVELSRFLEAK